MILSEIEQRIKAKIEAIGTPLKDWNVNIYRGILTGYNDAFIINKAKKEEILANCQSEEERKKTDELIRPILRGRDIKRYGYDFADLYLINTHNGVKEKGIKRIHIEDYPAVKAHLDLYYPQLEKRADQGDTPYNLRNCAYIEDFYKQKIVWKAVGRNLAFSILEEGKFVTAPASFITSENSLYYILGFLCSSFAKYFIYNNSDTTGAGDIMLNIQSLVKIPIPQPSINNQEEVENIISEIIKGKKENIDTILLENKLDEIINNILSLSPEEIDFIRSF
ncbi:TaqI-like C-terminal specificity domain-containing protein [Capnocytophaga granulosa]